MKFSLAIVPLITTFIIVFVKIVSRNDKYDLFVKEDFAIGLDLSITSLILLVNESVRLGKDNLNLILWKIVGFIFMIWILSTFIRKVGWKDERNMNIWCGIILPDIAGILSLIYVVSIIGGTN